jgi:hypothetical protein
MRISRIKNCRGSRLLAKLFGVSAALHLTQLVRLLPQLLLQLRRLALAPPNLVACERRLR